MKALLTGLVIGTFSTSTILEGSSIVFTFFSNLSLRKDFRSFLFEKEIDLATTSPTFNNLNLWLGRKLSLIPNLGIFASLDGDWLIGLVVLILSPEDLYRMEFSYLFSSSNKGDSLDSLTMGKKRVVVFWYYSWIEEVSMLLGYCLRY